MVAGHFYPKTLSQQSLTHNKIGIALKIRYGENYLDCQILTFGTTGKTERYLYIKKYNIQYDWIIFKDISIFLICVRLDKIKNVK